jgi:CO/xanthine dehydrogenase FAD-binding subunit
MDVLVPRTLEEALGARAERPEAVPVAGGTDLMVAVNSGTVAPRALLDLSRVEELRGWRHADGIVFVGAGMTFARIAAELAGLRPLAEAARTVGSRQIRNRATIGGNLATASPAGDSLPVLAAYDAEIVVGSRRQQRYVPWDAFLVGPRQTTLAPDELILGVRWRAVDGPGAFAKVGTRNAMVIAIAGVCVQLDPEAHGVRLALGSVAPTVVRARDAEAFAEAAIDWADRERPLAARAAAAFGRLAAADASPIDDVRGSAAYRRHAVEVLARRALRWTLADRRAAAC